MVDGRAGMWAGTWRVRVRADTNVVRARRGRRKRRESNGGIVAWEVGGVDGWGVGEGV